MKQLNTAPSSALLLDYDGTLAPFHTDRSRAYPLSQSHIDTGKNSQMRRIKSRHHHGATHRGNADSPRPMNNIEMWGTHGLERRLANGTYRRS